MDRTSFPIPLRHVVNLLESKKYLMSPAETMWRTNLSWYLVAITGPQQARNFPSCRELSSHFWSNVAFDRWPTHRYIRALRRACQITRQVSSSNCTVTKRSRSGTNTCASSLVCTSPLAVTSVVGSWIFEGFPVRLSSNPFCSACALMLQNRPRIHALLVFSKRMPA